MRIWALAIGAVLLGGGPAAADIEWVPEGRFHVRYSAPVQGAPRTAPDANFELVSGQFGTRLLIVPGLSFRAVGELLEPEPSRRVGDLRLGYAEWTDGWVGTIRAGQIPVLRDVEDRIVGDLLLGPGVGTMAGFYSPGGLGGSWARAFGLDVATATVEIFGAYSEGFLGSGALVSRFDPATSGHAAVELPQGWTVDLLARWSLLEDQQAAVAVSRTLWDVDWMAMAAASGSNPVLAVPELDPVTGAELRVRTVQIPLAADAAGMLRARYNLGNIAPALWRADLVGRSGVMIRNFTNTPTLEPSYPIVSPRTDLTTSLAVVYRFTDNAAVGLDATEERQLAPAANTSLFVGARAGVVF